MFPFPLKLNRMVNWKGVIVPATFAAAWPVLPFTIQKKGVNQFQLKAGFDLAAYATAQVTIAKTYWVKQLADGGNDTNTGLDETHAFATLAHAFNRPDIDRLYIKANGSSNIYDPGWNSSSPTRSVQVIAYGGTVISQRCAAGLSWTLVGNHYESACATGAGCIVDASVPDADGDYIPLIHVADSATVDSTPGTWYWASSILYVHTLDSRAPDANIIGYIGAANGRMQSGITHYLEGIEFRGGSAVFLASVTGLAAKIYAKNCAFKYGTNSSAQDAFNVTGGSEVILQNCVASRNGGDGFKMQTATPEANLALISCIGRWNGQTTVTNANGESRHGPGSTIMLNCNFHHNYGPNMADITDGTLTWMLGCNCHDTQAPGVASNYAMSNATKLWLDGCISSGACMTDLAANTASTNIYYRNMTPKIPTKTGVGTAQMY